MSKVICFKDGVYVIVESENSISDSEYYIINPYSSYDTRKMLYAGRVEITTCNGKGTISIDGISPLNENGEKGFPVGSLVNFLNAIEIYGIDAFIQNYKKTVEGYCTDLKEQQSEIEKRMGTYEPNSSEHNDLYQKFKVLDEKLSRFSGLLFCICIWMPTAITNEKLMQVLESVLESLG